MDMDGTNISSDDDEQNFGPMCQKNMYFTWDTTNICILARQWHVRSTAGLVTTLLVVVAVAAGYEALGKAIRRVQGSGSVSANKKTAETVQTRAVAAMMHTLEKLYALIVMLIFMTNNGWVMMAVVAGMSIGYIMFRQSY